jgi:hypothetical protein
LGLTDVTRKQLQDHLSSKDPVKRGYAIRALSNANVLRYMVLPDFIQTDKTTIDIYTGWDFKTTRISDIIHACTREQVPAGNE